MQAMRTLGDTVSWQMAAVIIVGEILLLVAILWCVNAWKEVRLITLAHANPQTENAPTEILKAETWPEK